MEPGRLGSLLKEAAAGRFPPADGGVEVVRPGGHPAVVAFTGHSLIAAEVPEAEILARLVGGDLAAVMRPDFLVWLGGRLGRRAGFEHNLLAAPGRPSAGAGLVPRPDLGEHPMLVANRRYRLDPVAYSEPGQGGFLVLGRGLAGRWEIGIRLEEPSEGDGRRLIGASLGLVPAGEHLFAQIAPGNARSLRAFLAAGFRPLGSEVLFLEPA